MKKRIIFGTIFPLSIGTLIYLLFRPETIRIFEWSKMIGINVFISTVREYFSTIELPNWIVYNLPNGLWIFGLTYFLLTIWRNRKDFQAKFWIATPLIIALFLEFSQLNLNNVGTFDFKDLAFYLIGFLFSLIFNNNFSTIKFSDYNVFC